MAAKPETEKTRDYTKQNLVWAAIKAVHLDRDLDQLQEFAGQMLQLVALKAEIKTRKAEYKMLKAKAAEERSHQESTDADDDE